MIRIVIAVLIALGLSVATVAGDTMTVLGQDGAEIGQLERSAETSAP